MCLKSHNSTYKMCQCKGEHSYPSQPARTETTFPDTLKTSESQTRAKSCNTLCILGPKHDSVHKLDGKGWEYKEASRKCLSTYAWYSRKNPWAKGPLCEADSPDEWHPQTSWSTNTMPPERAKRTLSVPRATSSEEQLWNLYRLRQLIPYHTKGSEKTV